jgi:hypothetical protein
MTTWWSRVKLARQTFYTSTFTWFTKLLALKPSMAFG